MPILEVLMITFLAIRMRYPDKNELKSNYKLIKKIKYILCRYLLKKEDRSADVATIDSVTSTQYSRLRSLGKKHSLKVQSHLYYPRYLGVLSFSLKDRG